MSVQAMLWVQDHSRTTGTDRLVLLALANHSCGDVDDEGWESWPGISLIGQEAGLRRDRTVQESLARLIAAGAITRELNAAPAVAGTPRNRRTNLYRILTSAGGPCGRARCSWCGPRDAPEHTPKAPKRGVAGHTPDLPTAPAADLPKPAPVSTGVSANDTQSLPKGQVQPQGQDQPPGPAAGGPGELLLTGGPPAAHPGLRLAADLWAELSPKPVAGYPAFRARVVEALDAGYTEAALRRVVPSMRSFTRDSFDFALRPEKRPGPRPEPELDAGRDLPTGKVDLATLLNPNREDRP